MTREQAFFFYFTKEIASIQKGRNGKEKATDIAITRKRIIKKSTTFWIKQYYDIEVYEEEILPIIESLIDKGLIVAELVSKQHINNWRHTGHKLNGRNTWKKREDPIISEYKEWEYRLTDYAMDYLVTLKKES